jgi:hypothetical protein
MNDFKFEDASQLYEMARGWYCVSPVVLLPDSLWESAPYGLTQDKSTLALDLGRKAAKPVDHALIAVMAAISVGMERESLAQVIKHHQLTPEALINCEFHDIDEDDEYVFIPDEFSPVEMTPWHISNEIIQAVSMDESLTEIFAKKRFDMWRQDLVVATIMSPKSAFWPSTHIALQAGTQISQWANRASSLAPYNFKHAGIDLSELSSDEIFEFLERSGHLSSHDCLEQGHDPHVFFRCVFQDVEDNSPGNLTKLARRLNDIKDPDKLDRLNRMIVTKICDHDNDDFAGNIPVLKGMAMALDPSKFKHALSSMVLKLNAISEKKIDDPVWLPSDPVMDQCLAVFRNAPDSIFRLLADELCSVKPEDFTSGHFRAMSFLVNRWGAQNLEGIDTNEVLLKVMEGLETYSQARHCDYRTHPTEKFKDMAKARVEAFVKWLSPKMTIDYPVFAKLDSMSKAILASNGFDIRKLPNMTRRDRGVVLTNELGL